MHPASKNSYKQEVVKEKETNSYISIFKSTATIGGIKFFEILINIARLKITALLLSPSGIGLQALLTSTVQSLHLFSTFGIFQSAVREFARAKEEGDSAKLSGLLYSFQRIVLVSGVMGGLVCILGAGLFSRMIYNEEAYVHFFFISGGALVFMALSAGQLAILQGLREIRKLAAASLIGISISLPISVPIFYFCGVEGIPVVLLVNQAILFLVSFFFVRKISAKREIVALSFKEIRNIGKPILSLGIVLMLSNGLMSVFGLALNAIINKYGSIADVGFFQSAHQLTYGNIIILVAILSADYFPRLSAVHKDADEISGIVNRQIDLLILIIVPVICTVIVFTPFIIAFLLSEEFSSIDGLVRMLSLSLTYRIVWHSLSFVILAKGDKKTYLIYDCILGNGIVLICNIFGYMHGGLYGLGISCVIGSVFMSVFLGLVVYMKYKVKYDFKVILLVVSSSLLCFALYLFTGYCSGGQLYLVGSIFILIVSGISVLLLNKRIALADLFKSFGKNKNVQ